MATAGQEQNIRKQLYLKLLQRMGDCYKSTQYVNASAKHEQCYGVRK